jgi:hypothetical protein
MWVGGSRARVSISARPPVRGGQTAPRTFAHHARWPIRGIYPTDKQRNLVTSLTIYPSNHLTTKPSPALPFLLSTPHSHPPILRSFYVSSLATPPDKPSSHLSISPSTHPPFLLCFGSTHLPISPSSVLSMFRF